MIPNPRRHIESDSEQDDPIRSSQDFVPIVLADEDEGDELPMKEEDDEDDYFYTKTKDYNIRTRDNPKDVALWMEFIRFQDEFPSSSEAPITEKKLSIYRKALQENPESNELLLGYLSTSATVLE